MRFPNESALGTLTAAGGTASVKWSYKQKPGTAFLLWVCSRCQGYI